MRIFTTIFISIELRQVGSRYVSRYVALITAFCSKQMTVGSARYLYCNRCFVLEHLAHLKFYTFKVIHSECYNNDMLQLMYII